MMVLPLAGDQDVYWTSSTSMPGYWLKTSCAALMRFSAGEAPARPPSITTLPSKFSVSASHWAEMRPSAWSEAVTKVM